MIRHPVLAIDHGDARVGLACTDPLGIAVHSLSTLPREKALEGVCEIIAQRVITQVVVGLPLHANGSQSQSADKARHFIAQLTTHQPHLSVDWVDERFSTQEAASQLRQRGLKAKQQKGVIDQVAAMEILHRWVEEQGESMRGDQGDFPPDFPPY